MNPLPVVIADDEPLVRRALRRFVESRPELTLVGEASDGAEAVELVERLRPELLFLDVQMPGLDGLAVARELGAERPAIIFVTAFDRYAVDAFELHAVDYVLKPFDEERLARAVDRAVGQREGDAVRQRLDRLLAAVAPPHPTRFLIRTGTRLQVLHLSDVEWFESADNYVKAHTPAGTRLLRGTLQGLAERLDPGAFVRVHRTAMVRLSAITEVVPRSSGDADLVLRSGARVPLSRQLRAEVIERIGREG